MWRRAFGYGIAYGIGAGLLSLLEYWVIDRFHADVGESFGTSPFQVWLWLEMMLAPIYPINLASTIAAWHSRELAAGPVAGALATFSSIVLITQVVLWPVWIYGFRDGRTFGFRLGNTLAFGVVSALMLSSLGLAFGFAGGFIGQELAASRARRAARR